MGKDDNTAGWILTTLVYALGGRMETGTGTKREGDARQPADRHRAATCCKTMRWTDNSMGSNFDYGWSDINQAFAAGKVGMYISGSDVYTNLVQAEQHRPEHLRPRADPAREEQERRRPRRRHLAAVRPDADAATQAAAMKWIDFYYEQPLINEAAGDPQREDARRDRSSRSASRRCPIFNKAQYDLANTLDQAVHQRAARAR